MHPQSRTEALIAEIASAAQGVVTRKELLHAGPSPTQIKQRVRKGTLIPEFPGEADGLPLPVTNKVASGRRVDCRWPDHNLTVELDAYRFHNSRHSWEQDRRREREARQRGDEFRRYTYAEAAAFMLAELRELLV